MMNWTGHFKVMLKLKWMLGATKKHLSLRRDPLLRLLVEFTVVKGIPLGKKCVPRDDLSPLPSKRVCSMAAKILEEPRIWNFG